MANPFAYYPYCDFIQPRFAAWLFSRGELDPLSFSNCTAPAKSLFIEWISEAKDFAFKYFPGAVNEKMFIAGYRTVQDQELFTQACWQMAFLQAGKLPHQEGWVDTDGDLRPMPEDEFMERLNQLSQAAQPIVEAGNAVLQNAKAKS